MAITSICEPGHNFVSTMNLYGGTFNQFRVYFKKFNIPCKFVEGQDPQKIKEAIDENTRAVYVETIGNPQFNVPDIQAISDVCHEAGIPLIVDNTFGMGYVCLSIFRIQFLTVPVATLLSPLNSVRTSSRTRALNG
jgi:O-acetylhomoserine/O-acetylserine sulfhydrylase